MKNKVIIVCFIIIIIALTFIMDSTNARFYSSVSMSGDLDFVKSVGKISIYHPEWIGGYTGPDNGTGTFNFSQIPLFYNHIHYVVTNKLNDEINEEETTYYIRIVAEDDSINIPIEYDVHEYNNSNNIYNLEQGVGYGPFTLNINTEDVQYYSIKANWTKIDMNYMKGIQRLKVQMVKKRIDNSLKVIDEAPLNIEYTGDINISSKINTTFSYYLNGSSPAQSIGSSQQIELEPGTTINFKNSEQLNSLGIQIPEGYMFYTATSGALDSSWNGHDSFLIPENFTGLLYIEVYCVPRNIVSVEITYCERINSGEDVAIANTTQNLDIPKGTTINFKDIISLAQLGVTLPSEYEFITATSSELDPTMAGHDSFMIPENTTVSIIRINVILKKVENVQKVTALIYNANTKEYIGEIELTPDSTGTFIFTKSSLHSLNPALNGKNSISIGIKNGENIYEIGNVANGNVAINYESVYGAGYSLKYGMNLYIGYWW